MRSKRRYHQINDDSGWIPEWVYEGLVLTLFVAVMYLAAVLLFGVEVLP